VSREDRDVAEGALAGIRVVELGQMVSAPYCAKLFADFGADVVKVEPPPGDAARHWGPFPGDVPNPEASGLYQILNTNKRGVTLDVATDAGRDVLLRLMEHADVLIENNPPAWMRQRGLDYATLSAANPNLVMISITPFGQTGPYSDWKGCDLNAFHLSAAGHRYCGRPGEAPLEHGTFSAEYYGAVTAAAWGLAATIGRGRVGGGRGDREFRRSDGRTARHRRHRGVLSRAWDHARRRADGGFEDMSDEERPVARTIPERGCSPSRTGMGAPRRGHGCFARGGPRSPGGSNRRGAPTS